jgi:hypothetical protein
MLTELAGINRQERITHMADKKAVAVEKNDLEKALDTALDDLKKAAGSTDLEKAEKKDEDEDEKGGHAPFAGAAGKGEGDEKKSGKGSAQEDEDMKDKKDEDDEDMKADKHEEKKEEDEDMKAQEEGYRKSVETDLTKSTAVKSAVEVSKFLGEIVKSLSAIVGDLKNSNSKLTKRIASLEKSNAAMADALVKSFSTQNEITKSLGAQIESFGGRPLARKSLPAGAKVEVLAKSHRGDELAKGGEGELSKSQIADKLAALEMSNKVPMGTTSKFEAAGEMSKSVEEIVFGKSEA